ncbi:MAG: PBP1A family penicillin-binding protein [Gammaproteobacteria bacterium]|jgi:penicillin-binding protein 1A|nr:PBP1A family penicillin-binding protein [Gammaproteobacteria bacterium]
MNKTKKIAYFLVWSGITVCIGVVMVAASMYLYISPKLPDRETYTNLRLENPLRIYSSDDKLIAEFGSRRSTPIKFDEIPKQIIDALVSTEDKRFYSHRGVDPLGLVRSVAGIFTGNDWGGGSTITMQVTKNFFFEGESPHTRKFKEILLALKMERELTKEEILELYLNKTFFGISAYGIAAAAQQYYDKTVNELSLAEAATMIGLLPRPNAYNPLSSRDEAKSVRERVLSRMQDQGMITQNDFDEANTAPNTAFRHGRETELDALYIAEMVRQDMIKLYGDLALTDGFEVYTTISSTMQETANLALQGGLENYDRRHGYRGRENHLRPAEDSSVDQWLDTLRRTPTIASQLPAFVQSVEERTITAILASGESITIEYDGFRWAKRFITNSTWGSSPRSADEVVDAGDLIRVMQNEQGQWMLGQIPAVNGGLVSLDPNTGAILSLVGGYEFNDRRNNGQFNRVTLATRQPGSNIKPFLYAAALENGYTAASLINDAPLARSDYRPENFNGDFMGPIRLKYALTQSKNLVSLRLYDALGSDVVLPYIARFGFNTDDIDKNDLTVAIGTHAVHPLEVATAYAVFANGGHKVEPFLIQRIDNFNDGEMFRAQPYTVCNTCENMAAIDSLLESNQVPEIPAVTPAPRIIDERVSYIMNSILRSVITSGSGRPANRAMPDREDIHGKTGTTNDNKDLWFSGFNGNIVTTVYVGYDQPDTLGKSEQAATVALPIWIDFMKPVLADSANASMSQPDDLEFVRINRQTGLRASPGEEGAFFEVFRKENVPDFEATQTGENSAGQEGGKSPF